ncbi:telomere-protecting terminal protein Tpg [Streptomyces sp. NBC_01803]|uniref:telomere-protecting terminal protein Tpg n=1 Tax=Streptomyces sp. NBC_01803 TaxID=2975946 RepID=UPI002DD8229F|nr:hypothetical protein [Streptomyces sp. NBC_01803]WSA47381.1 hypothetical protein OIE51_26330 [Streptomyces sp. NBC_01803]
MPETENDLFAAVDALVEQVAARHELPPPPEREVRRDGQPRVRQRAIRRAAETGITVETRARFGFTAAPGSTDAPRIRRVTEALPAETAARLLASYHAGADEGRLRDILAQGLGQAYFRDHGRRAAGLDVAIQDIDYLDIEL